MEINVMQSLPDGDDERRKSTQDLAGRSAAKALNGPKIDINPRFL
jgi:hypothetical protein